MTCEGDIPGQDSNPRKLVYKDILLLQLAAVVLLLDQFSKFLVRELLAFQEAYPTEGFFRIIHSYNTGSAFGMFQDQNGPLILVSLAGISVMALIYQSQRRPANLLRVSLGLQMGGAAGNLVDRVLLGHVIDFIDVGAWPVFNVADSSIVVGLVLLAWLFMRPERFSGANRSATSIATTDTVVATGRVRGQEGGYARCPLCDGDMLTAGSGWRCAVCGARERIDAGHGSIAPTEEAQPSSSLPSEAASSGDLAGGQITEIDAERTASHYLGEKPG